MSAKVEPDNYPLNWLRWIVVAILIGVGVWGNAYYSDVGLIFRVVALVAVGLLAFFVAINTSQGSAVWQVVKESQTEIRKVVWPTRQETNQTTLIVIALTILMGFILWGLDSLIGWIVSLIIG